MTRNKIKLTTEKEIKIFMDPLRQRVLRTMEMEGEPMTAKRLADKMGMTAPSAKHHLTKLESIGVVEPDHTEIIHGIIAQYYRVSDAEIRLGMDEAEFQTEKEIIAENQVMSVFKNLMTNIHKSSENETKSIGDCHTGVVHLKEEQVKIIQQMILQFVEENKKAGDDTVPYEFAVIYSRGK